MNWFQIKTRQGRIQDFPIGGGGRQPEREYQRIIRPIFPKKCMKIRKRASKIFQRRSAITCATNRNQS